MERWSGKVAVVTGASSGIGLATVKDLVSSGLIVIGLSRRLDKMLDLKKDLTNLKGSFNPHECDLSDSQSIKAAFKWIEEKFSKVHILINNAGILKFSGILTEGNDDGLRELIEVNLLGNVYCTKEAYRLMQAAGGEECHIVNVNSILGHSIPASLASLTYNLYPSSKHALRATTEVLRQELVNERNIRISSISPGLVKTNIAHSAKHPYADRIMGSEAILQVEDISRGILFIVSSPKHVTISELIITPTENVMLGTIDSGCNTRSKFLFYPEEELSNESKKTVSVESRSLPDAPGRPTEKAISAIQIWRAFIS